VKQLAVGMSTVVLALLLFWPAGTVSAHNNPEHSCEQTCKAETETSDSGDKPAGNTAAPADEGSSSDDLIGWLALGAFALLIVGALAALIMHPFQQAF